MNRRSFFRNLFGAAAAPLVPSVVKDIAPTSGFNLPLLKEYAEYPLTSKECSPTPWMSFKEWQTQKEIMDNAERRMFGRMVQNREIL